MDQLTSQLRLFYTQQLTQTQWQRIHNYLISTLTSREYQSLAQTEIIRTVNDPYLLFHLLTILQHAPTTEQLLQALLSHIRITPRETLSKAALVTSYHGLLLWSTHPNHPFLQIILSLLSHNGHTSDAVRNISVGVMLLTTSIELLSTKQKLTSDARKTLREQLKSRSNEVLSGLEIGARLAGPQFHNNVQIASVRALSSLVILVPRIVDDVLGVLSRCADGRFDDIGAEILSVVMDILGGRVGNIQPVVEMVGTILETIAMGGVVDDDFAGRLVALVEVVVRRCVTGGGLERVLNGLMGVTGVWAGSKPGWMIGALDCWISVLDTFEDNDMRGELVDKVYNALAKVCVERCMQNPVLSELDHGEGAVMEHSWDEVGDVADIPTDPVALSSCLFIQVGVGISEGFDDICSREEYIGKCVETLLAIVRLSPRVAAETAKFTISKLADRSNLANLITAAQIAFGLSRINPSLELLQSSYELLNAGLWREAELGVALLRTAAELVNLLEDVPEEPIRTIGGGLMTISQQALTTATHIHTVYAAAVLLFSLDASFRKLLFPKCPPLPTSIILTSKYPAISAMGVSSTLHWALFPARTASGLLEKWDDVEWGRRTNAAREMLQPVFAPSGGLQGMSRYASLVDVAMDITYGAHAKTVVAVWSALSERVVEVLTATVGVLCDSLSGMKNAQEGKEVGDVLARVLRALRTVKKVHGVTRVGLEPLIGRVLPFAEMSEMLTEACLGVVRSMVNEERLRGHAIALARSVIARGGGIGELAVGVLYEGAGESFDGVLGIVEGASSLDIGICRESLQALQKLNLNRRIFVRQEFVPVREGLARECLKILGLEPGREALEEEAVQVLWGLRECGDGIVERTVAEVGNVNSSWGSSNEFGVEVRRVVDDNLVRNMKVSL